MPRKAGSEDSWSSDRNKVRLTVTLPPELKEKVKEKIEYSSVTMSQLVEEKFRDFMDEPVNPDVRFEDMDEIECRQCGGIMTENALEQTDGECPGCGYEVAEE